MLRLHDDPPARIGVLLLLAPSAGACSSGEDSASPPGPTPPATAHASAVWFEDVASQSGLSFRHMRGFEQRFWFPEIMGAGLAWFDYDGDGKLDLYCVQSGDLAPGDRDVPGDVLYRNRGDGTFEEVTARAKL